MVKSQAPLGLVAQIFWDPASHVAFAFLFHCLLRCRQAGVWWRCDWRSGRAGLGQRLSPLQPLLFVSVLFHLTSGYCL